MHTTSAETLGLSVFRSRTGLRAACWGSYAIHMLEATLAYRKAMRIRHADRAIAWFLQTLIFGWFSLRLLRR
ncbi:unnamed protein product [Phaeothamnion confervicola]